MPSTSTGCGMILLMKVAVGRYPESGAPLASQWTISRLESAPSKTEAARLSAALLDQLGTTVRPGKLEVLDIHDTFCAAHGGQQLAFWNARITTSVVLPRRTSITWRAARQWRRSCARRARPRAARCAPSSGRFASDAVRSQRKTTPPGLSITS